MCCTIWAATLIVWPSPTIAWSPSPMAKSLFAGVILLTTTNRSCCPYRSMNSCAASYCTSFQKASCASVTSASWPTANAPRSYLFAFSCWVRHNSRKPNKTPPPPKTVRSWRCPKCGGPMKVIERLTAAEIQLRSPPRSPLRHESTLSNSKTLRPRRVRTSVPCRPIDPFFPSSSTTVFAILFRRSQFLHTRCHVVPSRTVVATLHAAPSHD